MLIRESTKSENAKSYEYGFVLGQLSSGFISKVLPSVLAIEFSEEPGCQSGHGTMSFEHNRVRTLHDVERRATQAHIKHSSEEMDKNSQQNNSNQSPPPLVDSSKMTRLQYYSYKGFGEEMKKEYWYNQAVRVGDRLIECSGQGKQVYSGQRMASHVAGLLNSHTGGWDPTSQIISPDLSTEIDQAFANVDLALKTAGGKGWSQVYKVNIYVTKSLHDDTYARVKENFKKFMPNHQPIYTLIGVRQLAIPEMHIEIQVSAHVGSE